MHDENTQLRASVRTLEEHSSALHEWFAGVEAASAANGERHMIVLSDNAQLREQVAALEGELETVNGELKECVGELARAREQLGARDRDNRALARVLFARGNARDFNDTE